MLQDVGYTFTFLFTFIITAYKCFNLVLTDYSRMNEDRLIRTGVIKSRKTDLIVDINKWKNNERKVEISEGKREVEYKV